MKNKSDTNLIRHYCSLHTGQIFDVHDVSKQFSNVTPSNFRKYVSRLVEEKRLVYISKGVYYIGNDYYEPIIDSAIIKYYIAGNGTRKVRESLLYQLKIIDTKPEYIIYKKCWKQGNKKILNYQFEASPIYLVSRRIELLDLVEAEKYVPENCKEKYAKVLAEQLQTYYEAFYEDDLENDHSRYTHLVLANLLDNMHISNRVMELYENAIKRANRLERDRI